MIESYTESADNGIFLTLIPREGIDACHVGIVSLSRKHPDAHPLWFAEMRHSIDTTAALMRAGVHLPIAGVYSTVDESLYLDRFNICYEFQETDAGSALIELRHISQQFANRDTFWRRVKRWFGRKP